MINVIPASKYCHRIFDGTHETPKPVNAGRHLVTSKNIKGGVLDRSTCYFISEEEYQDIQKRSYVSQWDVMFSMIGSVGDVYLEKNREIDYAVKNVGVFSCLDEDKAKWLYYFFRTQTAQSIIRNQLNGAVQKFLPLGALRNFPIPAFDPNKKCALKLLAALDAKIELNNQINAELEAMAKLLYDYWFVQFDFPMTAAQAASLGRPALEGKPYKSSGGKMVHNPTLNRQIPAGWKVSSVGSICENIRESIDPKDIAPDTPYVGLEHVPRHQFFLDNWSSAQTVTSLKSRFEKDDILFGKLRPYFHKVVKVAMSGVCTSELLVLRAKNPILRGLSGSILFSNAFVEYTSKKWGGAQMPRADWKLMRNFEFATPPDDLLIAFNQVVLPCWEAGDTNQKQNQELTQLRDWLLPMLMNGQVTVG